MKKLLLILFSLMLFFSASIKAESDNQDINQLLFDAIPSRGEVDLEKIEKYLKAGADPNWVNNTRPGNISVMSYFLVMGRMSENPEDIVDAIKLLVKYGAKASKSGNTLFWSISLNKDFDAYELTKLLLDNGASATTWNYKGIGTKLSPIETALKDGHDNIAELFVEYGASMPNKKIYIQEQFIYTISELGRDFEPNLAKLSQYLENGAKINGANKDGKTALVGAIDSLSPYWYHSLFLIRTIDFLLEKGADPNQLSTEDISFDKITALHTLSWHSQFQQDKFDWRFLPVYELLINNGAHISKKSEYQMTPLHYAAKVNNAAATEFLLSNYSKVSPKDKFGKTPLDYAESGEVIKLLKQFGAKE